ncbi:MAG: hypothetical protein GWN67_01255 [Phycisphaerae bacterium]|nr:hypothetical protein [Phycisphaerae bacterium]NIP50585.1 hypothetical protein [Phycisphaerae bacterium]NIS50796.1 hypothetical protein [Phycisphaerae bacterium]NIU07473.1 hypothetical protein [Phycisphaerae bacterium]NIU55063.1 hypothetical protein [Phycisphaerae bacterium]
MRYPRNIESSIKKSYLGNIETSADAEMDGRILSDALTAMEESKKENPGLAGTNIKRIIMKSPIRKTAAAAVIIIAVLFGLKFIGGPDVANTAWAEVRNRFAQIDYVHMYIVKSRGDDLFGHGEAWHAHGKTIVHGNDGSITYDDGRMVKYFDKRGMLTVRRPSIFVDGQSFLEYLSGGFLSDENWQLKEQIPTRVSDDFLIYTFDPPPGSDWLDTTSITVGRNSLLPIQVKIYVDDEDYDLFIFDYEAPEKPPEFFVPPTVGSANCEGKVVLDGEEVVLNISGAPGLKEAVVRLYDKYDGPAEEFPSDYISVERHSPDFCKSVSEKARKQYEKKGGPVYRLEVSFVTDEGYHSTTLDFLAVWLNEANQCGVGALGGGLDDWPDGKYRNIRFSPSLSPTDREDTYIVEIRCRIEPKAD